MATYPVIHKETGEQKEVSMSVHDWNKWLEDNPDANQDCLLAICPNHEHSKPPVFAHRFLYVLLDMLPLLKIQDKNI